MVVNWEIRRAGEDPPEYYYSKEVYVCIKIASGVSDHGVGPSANSDGGIAMGQTKAAEIENLEEEVHEEDNDLEGILLGRDGKGKKNEEESDLHDSDYSFGDDSEEEAMGTSKPPRAKVDSLNKASQDEAPTSQTQTPQGPKLQVIDVPQQTIHMRTQPAVKANIRKKKLNVWRGKDASRKAAKTDAHVNQPVRETTNRSSDPN
ncbi:hypothetical protein J5N97_024201 [Dioscorea zingiberensis]|uniref:Uncharacterized protein n=1 Tax=Dioscorea zingiberensis TaxID=325984 RepID=A0A9D5C6N5_9LILI|nr:hypothetical protein J5N97_024201 [Dioscorea zingiberensis]